MPLADEIILRRYLRSDIDGLVRYANNRNVSINLKDRFPFPYTRSDAEAWVGFCEKQGEPIYNFVIDLKGELIGGIGFEAMTDVDRLTASIGYWIAQPFWGRGFSTVAVERATAHGFATLGLERIQARVYDRNLASARVLEKVGFTFEGRMRRSIVKDGKVLDAFLYSRIR
jgi:RimJ/RimL family protein N-acetyltransferase